MSTENYPVFIPLSSYLSFPLFPGLYVSGPCSVSGVRPFSFLPPHTHCFGRIRESSRTQPLCVLWLEARTTPESRLQAAYTTPHRTQQSLVTALQCNYIWGCRL